ncbi:dTMP kinase [Bacillus shivajii]|uniref:dTMP kinase n=1 Tax=Bacillus shivajii TaxID=1983719 RepID=UPI001CFAD579|nr:dTMP kinase [Bacillus shivajii]UCZ53289.1 dTMP kinase [Bacillus shivajii]
MSVFITFEGGEGAGKTTVLQSVKEQLINQGYEVIATREPGGSVIAEKVRDVILNPDHTEMDERTEALLYAAARRQHLVETVTPKLDEGCIVLCDRFIDSSLVYQGVARGIGVEEVRQMNLFATGGLMPDLTCYVDIEPEVGLKRIEEHKGREYNRLDQEKIDFHLMVRDAYLTLAKQEPIRIQTIDGAQPLDEVVDRTMKVINHYLNKTNSR